MQNDSPLDTLTRLVEARNRGDLETAFSCYEPSATLVVQPGIVIHGTDAIRTAVERFISLNASFEVTARQIIEAEGVALHISQWTLEGIDPAGNPLRLAGRTADIVRRQPDGSWLLALDNPWGTTILD